MKKLLTLLSIIVIGSSAFAADMVFMEENINMDNIWDKYGKMEQKVTSIGYKIIYANKLKRASIEIDRTPRIINAFSASFHKTVYISNGILYYIDNDDEMAYIMAHELAHSMEAYDGFIKITAMSLNSKKYEKKADLIGIDYMVKAGYNPIAAIITANKIFGEPLWDWGFSSTHPKGSTRMFDMYKYIYTKYPKYLSSDMTQNVNYQNFLNAQSDEIKKFQQDQKKRQHAQNEDI